MGSRLRVGNLGFEIDLPKFKEIFAEFGTVKEAQIMISELSGKSRGFGFVEMSSPEEATNCLTTLNSNEREGRKFLITEAPAEKKRARRVSR